jgi:hypothetical protein
MSVEADELDALMARVKAEKDQHDPKGEFTDEEMAGIAAIANQPLDYWLHIAKTNEEPDDDFGLREKIDGIRKISNQDLCSSNDLLGPPIKNTGFKHSKPIKPVGGFIDEW